MTRQKLLAIALGGAVLASIPFSTSQAQSGDALAKAERACIDSNVRPTTPGFDVCVGRVAFALDRGEHDVAMLEARTIVAARDVCSSYGIEPLTLQYRACIATELDRRIPAGQARAVVVTTHGFTYDRDGNLLDQGGNIVRPALVYDAPIAEAR
jgi:hypothetical protein